MERERGSQFKSNATLSDSSVDHTPGYYHPHLLKLGGSGKKVSVVAVKLYAKKLLFSAMASGMLLLFGPLDLGLRAVRESSRARSFRAAVDFLPMTCIA